MQYWLAAMNLNQVAHHLLLGVSQVLLPTPTQETETYLQHQTQRKLFDKELEIKRTQVGL